MAISSSDRRRYCGQVSVQTRWPWALGLFDSLHANIGAEVDDVDGAVGYVAHFDGAVDGFFFGPVGAGGGEVGGVDTALADELVLEIVDDVATFAVELDDAAALGDGLHNLADEVVGAHADLVLSCMT